MNNLSKIKESIQSIAGRNINDDCYVVGEVTEANGTTCSVKINETLTLTDVLCIAADDGDSNNIKIKPKIGSKVLMADLSGGTLRQMAVVAYTQIAELEMPKIDSLIINGGKNGAIINIEVLTSKINEVIGVLNSLITSYNSHTHSVPSFGTSGTAVPNSNKAKTLCSSDFADNTIKH
ncbi:MAG: hypothetical protein J6L02_02220 [Bacteroidales bacterium]|nr:hypothetical protein [Bacteroidales bacterium]